MRTGREIIDSIEEYMTLNTIKSHIMLIINRGSQSQRASLKQLLQHFVDLL
jgi:hypothetical protein